MSAVTYTTFSPVSGNVVTREVQMFVPGLYSVISGINGEQTELMLDGSEVLELMKNDLRTVLSISFKNKALPTQKMGFSFYPAGFLANDEPVLVAYNSDTNNAYTLTLSEYHS